MWVELQSENALREIIQQTFKRPVLIFKHSTRCSISSMALQRISNGLREIEQFADVYYIDLLAYRGVSQLVSELLKVEHESPQVLLVHMGECVYEESHYAIRNEDVLSQIQTLTK